MKMEDFKQKLIDPRLSDESLKTDQNDPVSDFSLTDLSNSELLTMSCPKTKMNILQFCVLKNQNLDKMISLFENKDDLFEMIFVKKAQGDSTMAGLTAFEIAVA